MDNTVRDRPQLSVPFFLNLFEACTIFLPMKDDTPEIDVNNFLNIMSL